MHTNHGGDTISQRHYRAVGHQTTHFHDQTASGQKERRPEPGSVQNSQDLAWRQLAGMRIEDNMHDTFHDTG